MGKKSSSSSSSQTIYGNTTTANPYVTSTTDNSGTRTEFIKGNALDSIYNYVNGNINSLLDEYLNPNLNSTTNQAKLNAFTNTLNSQSRANLENNIINPLSNRNMIRSSQATDLYKNLSDKNTSSISSYINDLLAESQDNTAKVMNNLLNAYLQGYNIVAGNQSQSLDTSMGNASNYNSSSVKQGLNANTILENIDALNQILGFLPGGKL